MDKDQQDAESVVVIESVPTADEQQQPPYMDKGYAWVIVVAVTGIMMITWGINSSFGVYLAYYLEDHPFQDDTSPSVVYIYAMTMGLSVSLALLVPPVVNGIIAKLNHEPRIPIFIGLIVEFIGLFGASFVKSPYQLLLTQGLAFGLGTGFMFAAAVTIPPQWFHKRRSLAQGICVGGSGLGGLIFSLGSSAMLKSFGYQWSFRIISFIQLVISIICTILIRLPPKHYHHHHHKQAHYAYFNWSSLKRLDFSFLCLWGFFSMFGYTAILYSLSAYATSIIKVDKHQSGIVTACMCLANMFGRPLAGQLCDKYGRFNITILYTFFSGLTSLVVWTFAINYPLVIVFALLNGFVHGIFWVSAAPLTAEIVQIIHLPGNLTLVWWSAFPPLLVAELIAMAIRGNNPTRLSFQYIAIFAGICFLIATICLTVTRHQAKKNKSLLKSSTTCLRLQKWIQII